MDPYIHALMNDGLDSLLEEIPEWTASQGDELMESEDESDLLIAARRADQQGGNPLFSVNMERVRAPRSFHRGVAVQMQVQFSLQQLRQPNGEYQGEAVAEAFHQGLINFIRDPRNGITNPDEYSMSMAIHHSTGTHTWTSCPRVPLSEWIQGSPLTRQWLERLAKQLNSAESFDAASGDFYAELSFFKTHQRGGRPAKNKPVNKSFEQMLKKRAVITIKNKDELCFARALVCTKAFVDQDPQYQNISKGRGMQAHLAYKLHQETGVSEGLCGLPEIQRMQDHLGPQGYQIKIFEGVCGALWYCDPSFDSAPKKLCLLKVEQHFHGLHSVPALLNKSYYCHQCNKGYDHEDAEHHNCSRQNCDKCRRKNGECPDFQEKKSANVYCNDCGQSFHGKNCFTAHKKKLCRLFKKCPECCKVYKFSKKKKHVCGEYRCPNCRSKVLPNHQCYIQPLGMEFSNLLDQVDDLNEEDRAILEDMVEAEAAEKSQKEEDGKPPPLVCCIDFECGVDENKDFEDVRVGWQYVNVEGSYREAGKASDMLEDVMAKTVTADMKERKVFVFAHNMRGFDSSFILQLLYDKGYKVERVLSMGAKFLSFQCGNVIFRDSLNFFNMPLERLPATFNLKEAHKGFFPYSYISEDKIYYVGPYPKAEEYHPERMNEKRRKEFLTWHKEKVNSGAIFDCQKELSAYLKSDVQVLTESMETFASEMLELTGIDPTVECVTIASTAFKVFQTKFLEPYTIALEPLGGWRHNQQTQSVEALQWLEFQNAKIGGGIQHVRNSLNGEAKVITPAQTYNVDGYHAASNTVYEYQGCIFHGCFQCYPKQRNLKRFCHPDRTVREVYEATLKKTAILRDAGYNVVEMWGCDFAKQKETDPELAEFLKNFEFVPPLEPRDAFFGGRTGAATLYAKTAEDEEISYVDFTSLYPSINKYGVYPVGFPRIIYRPENQNINDYFGLAQVDILPPERLFHPVLPVRAGGKLTFPLCRSCVAEEIANPLLERSNMCGHTREQRMLKGTWCTPELQKAVEKGYQIQKIHEVWHFPEENRREGLFAGYVNTWLKLKQESAGWPAGVETPEQKAEYVKQYEEHEGIKLDPEKIAVNPGRKSIAKLLLNSLWGKFGERQNKPVTHCITQPSHLFQLLEDPVNEIHSVRICSEDVMELVVTKAEDEYQRSFKQNVFIAAFTTSLARLKLYDALDFLGERVLYYDTDSVIYKTKRGQDKLPLGSFLGEFTDEIDGDVIVEFCSGGAKNYGYLTKKGKVECKVRGFSLNYETKQILNYQTMKENILKELDEPLEKARRMAITIPDFFQRDQVTKKIKLTERKKHYQLVFDKRVIDPATRSSTPYGYNWFGAEVELLMDL